MGVLVGLGGAVLALGAPAPTHSPVPPPPTPAQIDLHWDAPAQCPTADRIEEHYRSLLTEPVAGVGTMRVDAKVSPTERGYRLELTTDYYDQVEQRRLDALHCKELADATAIVVAVALEPSMSLAPPPAMDRVSDEPAPSEPEHTTPAPPPDAGPPISTQTGPTTPNPEPVDALIEPVIEPDPEPTPAPRPRPQAAIRLASGVERGVVPLMTGLGELSLGLVWPRVRLELSGRYLWPRRVPGPQQASALMQLGAVGVQVCARSRLGPVELPVCGGVEGGVIRADSRDLDPTDRIFGPWLGPSASAGIAHHWSRVGIWASGMVVGRAWATRTLLGSEASFEPEFVSVRAIVGIEALFSIAQP